MKEIQKEIIKYCKKLNSTNLSPLRSGNISIRANLNNINGFYITPSGIKYEKLKDWPESERPQAFIYEEVNYPEEMFHKNNKTSKLRKREAGKKFIKDL